MTDTPVFINAAQALLGARGLTTDNELIEPWLTDWRGRYTGKAIAMASPATTQEVAAFVKLCATHGVPIVPQGGNSGMSGGATPDDTGTAVVLSLRRMNSVRRIDERAREITVDAGLVLQTLHEHAEAAQLRFPLTLGGKGSATIGGLISTNAGGTQVLRHGTMRDQVLGIEAVMADGSIFHGLTPLKKDNRGFDMKQLLIGSEGTLGIVTGATLKLEPQIAERAVMWAGLSSIGDARTLLLRAEAELSDLLEGFEVVPKHCLSAVLDHLPDARSPLNEQHEWHTLIELAADQNNNSTLADRAEAFLASAFEAELVADATIAANDTQAEQFWLLRDSIAPAERAIGPAMQHDISVPVADMANFVESAVPKVETRFPGTTAVGFGHLGDGNIHFHVLAPKDAERGVWEDSEGKLISAFVHDLVVEANGSISAEHGIGQMKRAELGRLSDPAQISIMRNIKHALDPQGILNPGKLVPLASETANA